MVLSSWSPHVLPFFSRCSHPVVRGPVSDPANGVRPRPTNWRRHPRQGSEPPGRAHPAHRPPARYQRRRSLIRRSYPTPSESRGRSRRVARCDVSGHGAGAVAQRAARRTGDLRSSWLSASSWMSSRNGCRERSVGEYAGRSGFCTVAVVAPVHAGLAACRTNLAMLLGGSFCESRDTDAPHRPMPDHAGRHPAARASVGRGIH